MALKKIVLDLETQKSFDDVGGRGKNHLLKISVCGVYDYTTDKYLTYEEHQLPKLAPILQTADQIIGFNIIDFDFQVLQPYVNFDLAQVPAMDLLKEIEKSLGRRISLDTVATATLGTGKSGDGRKALEFWKHGRMEELKKYCLDDVKITRQVYEYALKHGKILYNDYFSIKEIPLPIAEATARSGVLHQAALF